VKKPQEPLTDAERQLVEANIPLIYFVSRRYNHIPEATYEDLLLCLYDRLCRAVQEFDPAKGFAISSYLVKSLDGEIKNYFRDEIWMVRPPRRLREKPLALLLEGTPGKKSEAENQGENREKIRTCVLPVSLSRESEDSEGGGGFFPEVVASEQDLEAEVVGRIGGNQILKELFSALQMEERIILALRIKGKPLREIQERFGVTRAVASAVWREVKDRVAEMYLAILEGRKVRPSSGSPTLRRALRIRVEKANEERVRRDGKEDHYHHRTGSSRERNSEPSPC
jgi:RNA polymerase sigma-B factor